MSTVVNLWSRTAAVGKKGLLWLGMALLVSIGLLGPSVPLAQAALWYVIGGGPPLDFDAPHNGQVVAHIDVLGNSLPILHGFDSPFSDNAGVLTRVRRSKGIRENAEIRFSGIAA